MNTKGFETLMWNIANGWNEKKPRQAVECFTPDATYMEPPDKQFFQGHKELYEYFGGDKGVEMKLTWQNLFFNESTQKGSGEYTFEMNGAVHHGVAIVELEGGKIKMWQEYDTSGTLSYGDFIKTEGKNFKFTIKELIKS